MREILHIADFYGGYGEHWVLKEINCLVNSEEIVAVAGPNGCGKSSLIRGICHLLTAQKGIVRVLGKEFKELGYKGFARLVAVVPQDVTYNFHFSVEELVMMGRIPYIPRFKPRTANDLEVVHRAIESMDLITYRKRMIHTLSGGEKQRVSIAQALAQEPTLLLLDEPTAFLDLNHQMEIMELLQDLSKEQGICILFTSHDLNLAAMFSTRLLIMKDGVFVRDGKPKEVISKELLKEIYGVDAEIIAHPDGEMPHIMLRKKPYGPAGKSIDTT